MPYVVVTALSARSALRGFHYLVSSTPSPTPSPSVVSSDSASALPFWLLVALMSGIGLIVLAMFALTAFSLSAPRSTLKNVLGLKRRPRPGSASALGDKSAGQQTTLQTLTGQNLLSGELVEKLANAARSGKRTTRTTLAIGGFSLLGVIIVAIFGLSGQGVRDLRSQVVASVTTLVASIAGFYFGSQAATKSNRSEPGSLSVATPEKTTDPASEKTADTASEKTADTASEKTADPTNPPASGTSTEGGSPS